MATSLDRCDRLRARLKRSDIEALLVTNPINVTYLTGFTGDDSYLLISQHRTCILSDPRFETQIAEECPDVEAAIRRPGTSMPDQVVAEVKSTSPRALGIESNSMTVALFQQLQEKIVPAAVVATSGLIEALRAIKDKTEVEAIRQAVRMAERAFAVLRASLTGDQTEKQLADELESQLRRFGARGTSFSPIVAVGSHAALPHAQPTLRTVAEHPLLLVDWGARGALYSSDLTRILVTDRISTKLERVYGVVLRAQRAAIEAIRPGVTAHDVDQVARGIIAEAGFGRQFGHSLGHGLGLEVHESPRLGPNQRQPLKSGMVVTVEPGVYLPGWGGVRIEDDVLVTRGGHEVLSGLSTALEDAYVRL